MDGRLMIPMGIDLSLTSTGVSCQNILSCINSPNKGIPRLIDISEQLTEMIEQIDGPIVGIIEGYSFASRNSQAHSLGELGGVIRTMLFKRSIPWVNVPPTVRAKFATGRGNAAKTEVMSAVSARTGLVFSGKGADDMCDAWILEEIGLVKYGTPRSSWPEANLRALDKIEWA